MGPGDVTSRQNDDHNSEAIGGGEAQQGLRASCLLVNNGCGCSSKDQYQSPYELSPNLVFDNDTPVTKNLCRLVLKRAY